MSVNGRKNFDILLCQAISNFGSLNCGYFWALKPLIKVSRNSILNRILEHNLLTKDLFKTQSTHLVPMHLSSPPENIRKPYGFIMFQGVRKDALGTNGL